MLTKKIRAFFTTADAASAAFVLFLAEKFLVTRGPVSGFENVFSISLETWFD